MADLYLSDSEENEQSLEKMAEAVNTDSRAYMYQSSSKLDSDFTISNPLNPKTKKNIKRSDQLAPTAQRSSTLGKRWTSVQAWSYSALNSDEDQTYRRTDLVITTNIKPVNNSGWDQVVNVQDVTSYNPSAWSGGTAPNSASNMTIHNTGTHIELRYDKDAFLPAGGYYNYPGASGAFPMQIRVSYLSGHIESFNLLAPVGSNYRNSLNYNYANIINLTQDVRGCGEDAWYSKTNNSRWSSANPGSDYSILTRYKPENNPSGTLLEVGHYETFHSGVSNPFHILHPTTPAWGDPLTYEFGNNGVITPDMNQTAKQKFYRIDATSQYVVGVTNNTIDGKPPIWFETNYTQSTYFSTSNLYYDDSLTGSGQPTSFDSLYNSLTNNNVNQLFTYTAYYSENITPCGATGLTEYYVCDTPGNPSYWQTTFLGSSTQGQCNTLTIPVADRPGGSNYSNCLFIHDPACCTTCTLAVSVTSSDASYGVSDGILSWDARSQGSATGNPWGSGSMYTVAVTNAAGTVVGTAAPTGSNTFTDATCDTASGNIFVGCNSSVAIKPGMQVSGTGIPTSSYVGSIMTGTVSIDVTQFSLVNSLGVDVPATATNTNTTLTFSTGMYGEHGALAPNTAANPFYQVCVTDEDTCTECAIVIIGEKGPPYGCTDSTAVNYDSTAVVDDNSCIICNATDGLLHDPLSGNTTPLFDTLSAGSSAATAASSTAHNSDGTLSVSAAPVTAILPYLTFDVNSKFELLLYKTVGLGDASTAVGATQIGGTINAGTLNNVTVAAHTWGGLAYGWYTIRVRYVDTNTTSTTEDCWTEWYGIVQAEVCDDPTNSSYNALPTDPGLRASNPSLCTQIIPCCQLDPIVEDNGGQKRCFPELSSEVDCDPNRTVLVEWFYSPAGSSWTSIGSYNLGLVTIPTQLFAFQNNNPLSTNWAGTNGTGFYKVKIQSTYINGQTTDVCIEEEQYFYTVPLSGCMTIGAHNYDPAAICPGPCAFPSWDCDPVTGLCFDPWTGAYPHTPGPYNCETGAGCCNNYCVPPPTDGCTDPCAVNYDPTVTVDDGSCEYTACLDPNASNQYQNCCNSNYYAPSQIIGADNSCCIDPCLPVNTISITSTNSTSTCTVFNNDGTVNVAVVINNIAQTWTWVIWDNSMTSIIYSDTTGGNGSGVYSGSGTSDTYSLLGTGNYNIVVTDNLGCEWSSAFTIGSTSPLVGCTDPAADNYDPNAICDCCCQICGCLDPNASNYNPNANTSCQCEYDPPPPSPCIPATLHEDIERVRACLVLKGTDWLKDYKLGRADDCTLMNKWKLILIEYLLSQEKEGLSCLFNCADIQTPDPTAVVDCNELWITGGPSTGLNHDPNHAAASIVNIGEGTTVTGYDGFPLGWYGRDTSLNPPNNFTFVGDVVKWDLPPGHPMDFLNDTIWTLTLTPSNPQGAHFGCTPNGKITHYTQCLDYNTVSITTTTNYYDNFLNFVNKFCADCNISILNNKNS